METGIYFYISPDSTPKSIRLVVAREWLIINRDYKMASHWHITERYTKLAPSILGVWKDE